MKTSTICCTLQQTNTRIDTPLHKAPKLFLSSIAKTVLLLCCLLQLASAVRAEDGYQLWLRYPQVSNNNLLQQYRSHIQSLVIYGNSPTLAVLKKEMNTGLEGLLGKPVQLAASVTGNSIVAGTPATLPAIAGMVGADALKACGGEGFIIKTIKYNNHNSIVVAGNTDIAVMYGGFHLLRLLQTQQAITQLNIISTPKVKLRVLNHWDNLDRSVERGYAGISIFDWHTLPGYADKRYTDYARANASIGINGSVLNNVNANALILTPAYLEKVAAVANIFRPYGIKVYLSVKFSSPMEAGKLATADPLDPAVQDWWRKKVDTIYQHIPDFGGFLVKANSEGQPGPQNYNRTHAEGANMLAQALEPHGGVVMWRAFVYSNTDEDRFKQAYNEFKPLDGTFRSNVLVQVKNGPIDFQPREPFHPLFGAMPQTPLMLEFQLTQEYLGFATHLVFMSGLFKEVLTSDTWAKGEGSTVAKVIDGSLYNRTLTGMAGVANIGNSINWTGHPFGQANWYAFGRLAWNHQLTSEQVAGEWVKQTFNNSPAVVDTVQSIMLRSHQVLVNYMTPLGLHHIMGYGHHYGPAPWYDKGARADWNPVYFHRADSAGIGFDRTASGSNALAQYAPQVRENWGNVNTVPDEYLLWFHHVDWNHVMPSGNTLWQELCYRYYSGVDSVRWMQQAWNGLAGKIDDEQFERVAMLLSIQEKEAVWWRNACVLYFQTFARQPIPAGLEKPDHTLAYYQSLEFPFAPGHH